jgi:RimJ/RimL family protein N-acetyltransferase
VRLTSLVVTVTAASAIRGRSLVIIHPGSAMPSWPTGRARDAASGRFRRRAASLAAVGRVLMTERLVLRPVTGADHAGLLAHWTAPEVRRFLFDGAILSPAEITAAIEDSARNFTAAGYGL